MRASRSTFRGSSFTGNTITRDKVIRRELLLEEGQIYNSQLWELSILRLNQLNYFDTLKADQDSESRQNADDGTVDLLLKLQGEGQELDRFERRYQRPLGNLYRFEL